MYLCEALNTTSALAVNRMRRLVKSIEEAFNNECLSVNELVFSFIVKYRDKSLPSFYEKENVIQEIIKYAKSDKFLDYIYIHIMEPSLVSGYSQKQNQEIEKVIVYLMSLNDVKKQYVDLLKLLANNSNVR